MALLAPLFFRSGLLASRLSAPLLFLTPLFLTPLLAALSLAAILTPGRAHGQTEAGFVACSDPAAAKDIVGSWLHDSVQTHGQFAGFRVWTRLQIHADGEAVEDYFFEEPGQSDLPAFARLFATWTSGSYIDPEADKGVFEVIRLAPYLSATFNPTTGTYDGLGGLSLPVFRRFILSPDGTGMALSTSVFLGLPSQNQALSFPADFESRDFVRQSTNTTAVADLSWGRIKSLMP
jgi:hypothetical protein